MEVPQVPFDDRGLAYGDGLFETVLLRDGRPLLWDYHLARLKRGCRLLDIPCPAQGALEADIRVDGEGLEVLKLIVTRGSGGRGYACPEKVVPRLLSSRTPFHAQEQHWRNGVRVRLCELRLGHQPRLAGIKHLNRLENVLARNEWQTPDIVEGLVADHNGRVIEATSMNLFWCHKGQYFTPYLDQCGVAGTLREALLAAGEVTQAHLDIEELSDVEALWIGNSVQGMWPVAELLDTQGAPWQRWSLGTASRRLQAMANRLLGYPQFS
ncbi:aminodeoxychorismate lyase [Halomonas sp. ZH2S]|uniref:Aminodeoxychorismate lyase n=1 Tax=Vreelandella zhuhanensis TaxID=2684210 RepID=A0A7X3GZD3_9GAMM|nr:aminodeoxychorismate lyase [Halomonas zhuhanensis]MWJ26783.1 aminodeoxychorismate lyase [Halomonas zhuhanensis]